MLRRDPNQPPEDGLPPQEVRITELSAAPWPEDGRRVRVNMEVTPFLERPNLEVIIQDSEANEVASITIIELLEDKMTFTMHIRREDVQGTYTLLARIQYAELGVIDEKSQVFEASSAS